MSQVSLLPLVVLGLSFTNHVAAAPKSIVEITGHIARDTLWSADHIYVVTGEIHVRAGVQLVISDHSTILIKNGDYPTPAGNVTGKSALIFDSGSQLTARTVYLKAGGADNNIAAYADNAGVSFLGSASIAEKDKLAVTFTTRPSRFSADALYASYLGHADSLRPAESAATKDDDAGDDIDAINIIAVTGSEWEIGELHSQYSGDDGVDIENSDLTLRDLTVTTPNEDGVNITSSRVSITGSLVIAMTSTGADDRDIFDMEWDDGRPFLRLMRNCKVDITGVFGDEMTMISDDLPQPRGEDAYSFDGRLRSGQTYIYAHGD
ncbi:hypothetical protein [Candidatus Thiodictyon syntrophicum]|jgi:hypothetical protein|uniref:Organic solvent tolerance-like N-terminal domain-containing protein n=1 Tax=Candidatus Thiodictyon syntrophicum TaxID=1166950 RepID=A0A2K8U949_9GAMM|nr:hypothetical protein [Candidatus Thiodictyon syntrophicum]AUB81561.1 hypothetical protein THSYN_11745 [Candidatus Thiodictyon syntrophicum]